jgi:hypothetical protein
VKPLIASQFGAQKAKAWAVMSVKAETRHIFPVLSNGDVHGVSLSQPWGYGARASVSATAVSAPTFDATISLSSEVTCTACRPAEPYSLSAYS